MLLFFVSQYYKLLFLFLEKEQNPFYSHRTNIMKVNKIFSYMGLVLVTLINIMFLSSAQARSSGPCAALGACNRNKVNNNWDNINLYGLKAGNSILDHMNEIFINIPANLNSLIEQQQRQITSMYYRSSPRYDIVADNKHQMELWIDLPGVIVNDVSLTVLEEGKILKVAGSRKYKAHGETVVSEFDQMFTIDPSTLDIQKIEARLTDGVLVITAPKLLRTEEKERRIPIVVDVKNIEEKEEKTMIENQAKNVNEKEEVQVEEIVDDFVIMEEENINI